MMALDSGSGSEGLDILLFRCHRLDVHVHIHASRRGHCEVLKSSVHVLAVDVRMHAAATVQLLDQDDVAVAVECLCHCLRISINTPQPWLG